jgi:LemA protein
VKLSGAVTVTAGLVCLVLVILVAWALATYNRLVRLRNQVEASWAQIAVQLKRRFDLVPSLVETVRGAAGHERGTLEAVMAARSAVMRAPQKPGFSAPVAERSAAEGALGAALGRLFALTESYPELRANENFRALQAELAATEDKIAYARQFYNSAVQTFNTAVQTLPTSLVAAVTGFREHEFFAAVGDEHGPVQVRF